jgi:Fe-S-cluster containining protein
MENDLNRAEWSFFVTTLKEEARDVLWKVGSSVAPETLVKSVMKQLEALGPKPEAEESRSQEEIWKQVKEVLLKAAYDTRPYCIKCGECCSKGSPTLTLDDVSLLRKGKIGPNDVFTIRTGEVVSDNRVESTLKNQEERIKIRETADDKTCIFYQKWNRQCSIYDDRPAQCRLQECWDPKPEAFSDLSPLTRYDLLRDTGDIWQIIQRHDERCSHEDFSREISRLGATKGQTVEKMLELLSFDHHVREFVTQELGIDGQTLELLFGRPLSDSLHYYGLEIEEQSDGTFILRPVKEHNAG